MQQDVLDIQVVPLSSACGAEIRGVDLTKPLSRETVEAIRAAWNKHLVLVFRGQTISQEQQLTFASYFGDLGSRKKAPEPLRSRAEGVQQDHEKVLLVSNIKDDQGVPIGAFGEGEFWFHIDSGYSARPYRYTFLYALELPSTGGNTMFSNMYKAYGALPDALRQKLADKRALHIHEYNRARQADASGDITAIVVPTEAPGFLVEPAYRKMGWHASDTHPLRFDSCRVPVANTLGPEGAGFRQFLAILDDGRVAIAALAVGLAQACLEQSVRYAGERIAFGAPIGAHQGVAFRCADLAVMVENARLLTYKAAWLKDSGRPFKQAAAMAKLYATEAAVDAARHATQIFGGAGFMDESPVSRFYRDAKVLEIGEGTSEIQRLVIGRELGLPVR